MPYPNSPFSDDFDYKLLMQSSDDDDTADKQIQNYEIARILKWLCQAPNITSFRVNTLRITPQDALKKIDNYLDKVMGHEKSNIKLEIHPLLRDAIILHHPIISDRNKTPLKIHKNEVLIDNICATAILRGAHLYAPGVLSMLPSTKIGDNVSIYADVSKKCKKGYQKIFEGTKIHIANGIVQITRNNLFCEAPIKGVAVTITETISNCPQIDQNFLSDPGLILLQNLPSIICIYVLNPQANESVLDMCASPGNKTTHIAVFMRNQGRLVAVDKTPNKIKILQQRCEDFSVNVEIYQRDSTKLLDDVENFKPNSFDKILLDAPCSALGKRPQLINSTPEQILKSYIPLQKKLFNTAVALLKIGGILVYSTCTITLSENEEIIAWALKKFNSLQLIDSSPVFGGPGLKTPGLNEDNLKLLQRFGPDQKIDSVGFFIAKFTKIF